MNNYRFQIAAEWIKRFGFLRYIAHAGLGLFSLTRLDKPVVYQSLMKAAQSIETDPFKITNCLNGKIREELEKEVNQLKKIIEIRLSRGKFPANWNSGIGTAQLLYLMTRRNRFSRILEIGTGNGVSTVALFRALITNSPNSNLVTVDTSNSAGSLLNDLERSRIAFEVVKPDLRSKKSIFSKLSNFRPDLVFIDGAHDYLNVINDLELSLELEPRVLIADDIEVNEAWRDFCSENNLAYKVFLDGRKVLGICFLS